MTSLAICNGTAILPDRSIENACILCHNGRITYVGPSTKDLGRNSQVIDARGGLISPGFVDIHVHGGADADFMDANSNSVLNALRCHARHGTTSIFPTTTTGTPEQISSMLESIRSVQSQWLPEQGSRIAGVHLYGPYFAENKVGCHSKAGRRDPVPEEFQSYFQDNLVRIATCAAELSGADSFYRRARKNKCLITCGHSNASWTEMESAFRHGVRHVDHFWCAMSSVTSLRTRFGTPMQASMEQFVLANPEMSTEVIADGCHLADDLLAFAFQMKGPNRLCLVTDCSRALDMPKGRYRFGNRMEGTWFEYDGKVGRTLDGTGLASSAAGMDQMIRIMKRATGAPIHEVIRMASLTPAERTQMSEHYGSLNVGKVADIVILNRRLFVQSVIIRGSLIYDKK